MRPRCRLRFVVKMPPGSTERVSSDNVLFGVRRATLPSSNSTSAWPSPPVTTWTPASRGRLSSAGTPAVLLDWLIVTVPCRYVSRAARMVRFESARADGWRPKIARQKVKRNREMPGKLIRRPVIVLPPWEQYRFSSPSHASQSIHNKWDAAPYGWLIDTDEAEPCAAAP